MGYYNFDKDSLSYEQYDESYTHGKFVMQEDIIFQLKHPIYFIHTGKTLTQHLAIESIGFEEWLNYYYDSNDSLIRLTISHRGDFSHAIFKPGFRQHYNEQTKLKCIPCDKVNFSIQNTISRDGVNVQVGAFDWEYKDGKVVCSDNNAPDPMKNYAEWKIKRYHDKDDMSIVEKIILDKAKINRTIDKFIYDPMGGEILVLSIAMNGDTTIASEIDYNKNKKLLKLTKHSYSYPGKRKQLHSTEVRVYKYDAMGNLTAYDQFYQNSLINEYRWKYHFYDE